MSEKRTDDLKQELMDVIDLDQFLEENEEEFNQNLLVEQLTELLKKCNLSKAAVARRAGVSEVYLHQIFAGKRKPSRNRLLCLCYGLGADAEDVQILLKQCCMAELYPKNKRDAIIYYGLVHKLDLHDINDKLFEQELEVLL